jgi:cyanophycinase
MLSMIPRCLLLTTTLILTGSPARADDNVLGLPRPHDTHHPGALLLHGGGRMTTDAYDRFVALAGGPRAHIVLVPSAGYRPSDYPSRQQLDAVLHRRYSSWLQLVSGGKASGVDFLYTDDPNDADNDAFLRPLTTATGVWFTGGTQARLNYRFVGHFPHHTKFQAALSEVLARGGVVGGTSAGMAALPEIMTVRQDRRGTTGPLVAVAGHGFGLLKDAIVEQHFDGRNGRFERFTNLLRDDQLLDKLAGRSGVGANMLGLAVEESTGLVVQTNHLEVVGLGHVHVFIKGPDHETIIWHALKAGNKAALHRDRRGDVTLVKEAARQ